jgi:hypothetical protein
MPSAVIEVRREYGASDEVAMMELVHDAIVRAFRIAPENRNVTFVSHKPHRFLGRAGCPDPDALTNVTLYALPGRSTAAKRELYRLIVEGLERFGVPRACVLIRLVELPGDNFGVRGGVPLSDVDLGYPVAV